MPNYDSSNNSTILFSSHSVRHSSKYPQQTSWLRMSENSPMVSSFSSASLIRTFSAGSESRYFFNRLLVGFGASWKIRVMSTTPMIFSMMSLGIRSSSSSRARKRYARNLLTSPNNVLRANFSTSSWTIRYGNPSQSIQQTRIIIYTFIYLCFYLFFYIFIFFFFLHASKYTCRR